MEEGESGSAVACNVRIENTGFRWVDKHPRDAPIVLSVLHRKGRSGR